MTFKPGETLDESRLNQASVLAVGRVVFQATRVADQSIPNSTFTPVQWDTVEVDVLTGWAAGTPSRFTPSVAGYYSVSGHVSFATASSTTGRNAAWSKNGTMLSDGLSGNVLAWGANSVLIPANTLAISMNGTTDYLELNAFQAHGSAVNTRSDAGRATHITITYGGAL